MCVLRALLRRPAIVLRMFARLKSTHDKVCHWKCFQAKAVPVTGYKGAATVWLCFPHFSDFANPEFSHLSYHALVPVSPLLVNSHYKAVCASQQKKKNLTPMSCLPLLFVNLSHVILGPGSSILFDHQRVRELMYCM